MTQIDLYAAITQMREISKEGGTFGLKFRKWDRQRRLGGDLAVIERARIRPSAREDQISNASRKLFLVDADTGRALNCWQPLVMEFNGMQIVAS